MHSTAAGLRWPYGPCFNYSKKLINYASLHNPRPKCLLRRLNYSFEWFDVLENCLDARDGRCCIIQWYNVSTQLAHVIGTSQVIFHLKLKHMYNLSYIYLMPCYLTIINVILVNPKISRIKTLRNLNKI